MTLDDQVTRMTKSDRLEDHPDETKTGESHAIDGDVIGTIQGNPSTFGFLELRDFQACNLHK